MPLPAVFLDRDGTLNRAYIRDGISVPPADEAQLEIMPGVPEALATLKTAGFGLVVVTNQPDVARGRQSQQRVERINAVLRARLPMLDQVLCCFHDDVQQCACRKPAPGMLMGLADLLGLDLQRSFMVGDSWRDIEAGRRAGCRTIQIRAGTAGEGMRSPADFYAANISEASRIVLAAAARESHHSS